MSGTKVPRDPNLTPEMRRFLDDVSRAIDQLNGSGFATIASPTFTGDPKAPTPSPGDDDTSIATTAFVTDAVDTAISGISFLTRIATESVGTGTTYTRAVTAGADMILIQLAGLSHDNGTSRSFQIELSDNSGSTWSSPITLTQSAFAAGSTLTGTLFIGHNGAFAYYVTEQMSGNTGGVAVMSATITHYRLSLSGAGNFDAGIVMTWSI